MSKKNPEFLSPQRQIELSDAKTEVRVRYTNEKERKEFKIEGFEHLTALAILHEIETGESHLILTPNQAMGIVRTFGKQFTENDLEGEGIVGVMGKTSYRTATSLAKTLFGNF